MVKICSLCERELPKAQFSKTQWGKNKESRRCADCSGNQATTVCVDVCFGIPVDKRRLELLLCVPGGGVGGSWKAELPSKQALPAGTAEFVVTHTLSGDQVSDGLMCMARVQALASDEFLAQEGFDHCKQVVVASGMFHARNETAALSMLYDLLTQYANALHEAPQVVVLKRMLVHLRGQLEELVRGAFRPLLAQEGACGTCEDCHEAGSPWTHVMAKDQFDFDAHVRSVVACSKALTKALPSVVFVQAVRIVFLWLTGRLGGFEVVHARTVPLELSSAGPDDHDVVAALLEDEGEDPAFLHVYKEKMNMWGSWLLAQLLVCGTINQVDLNGIGLESVSLRRNCAWAIPTREALDLIAKHSPLVEIGAGSGYWSFELRARGADVVTYDSAVWDPLYGEGKDVGENLMGRHEEWSKGMLEGGPEVLDGDSPLHDRTLLLVWPDYQGQGTYGLECLQRYRGTRIVLVGEWADVTLGSYQKGLPPSGQSFAPECQAYTEATFDLVASCRLPSFPMAKDVVRVYERRLTL